MRPAKSIWLMVAMAAGLPALLSPRAARACGGFFCNNSPPGNPPPVAQTAENVAFAVDEDPATGATNLEAHIQIFYTGPADKFSWVVPVEGLPTLGVGTNAMFAWLSSLTQPSFSVDWHTEGTCKPWDGGPYGPPVDAAAAPDGGSDAGGGGGGGVDVAFRGDVGPYDAAVVRSDDPAALKTWLGDNMYYVSDAAAAIISAYVAEKKYFVALKLLNGKTVQEIQPIVLRFSGTAPCVPLRLTAIAAINDLRVNLWVVGPARVVPSNYIEIQLDWARLDWLGQGQNYAAMVRAAADEAGGNAFIPEYAGTARIMDKRLWSANKYNLSAFRAATTPPDFVDQIISQMVPRDGQLAQLMRKYIPLPDTLAKAGVTENRFWSNLHTYWTTNKADFAPFDANAFTDAIDAAIIKPAKSAQEMFDRHPYLTRLATYISPEEMTKDPMFVFNDALPDVPAARTANAYRLCGDNMYGFCDAPVRLVLPDGRIVRFRPIKSAYCAPWYSGNGYDRSDLEKLPALEVGWTRDASGQGTPTFDNRATIAAAVNRHNAAVSTAVPPPRGEPPASWYPAGGWGDAGGPGVQAAGGGCSCRHAKTGGGGSIAAVSAIAVGAVVTWRRRRRRQP